MLNLLGVYSANSVREQRQLLPHHCLWACVFKQKQRLCICLYWAGSGVITCCVQAVSIHALRTHIHTHTNTCLRPSQDSWVTPAAPAQPMPFRRLMTCRGVCVLLCVCAYVCGCEREGHVCLTPLSLSLRVASAGRGRTQGSAHTFNKTPLK